MKRASKRVVRTSLPPFPQNELLERRILFDAVLAADINQKPGNNWSPPELISFGNTAYFAANDGQHGIELWRTDGTSAGTSMVKDISPGLGFSRPQGFAQTTNGTIYFSAATEDGFELWKTDGTDQGTSLVKDINPGPASSNPTYITPFGNKVFFYADDSSHGKELWMSDGTEAGTQILKDIQPGTPGQSMQPMTVCNGNLYFYSADNSGHQGLWKSTGTPGDATFITSVSGIFVLHLASFQNRVYFTDSSNNLYTSTGDVGNKTTVQSNSATFDRFVNANGVIYYDRVGNAGTGVYRLSADGLTSTLINNTALTTAIGALGGDLYVSCSSASAGAELFRIKSTDTSASLVADVVPGSADSSPANLTGVGNKLYFTTGSSATGYSLWVTQGSGATFLKSINPAGDLITPRIATAVNGHFVILADDPIIGNEFLTSTGTPATTDLLKDIYPGTASSQPFIYGELNGQLIMYANDSIHGTELWALDAFGNATLLQDVNPGSASGFPGSVYIADNQAFFAASDGVIGNELYVTDGTPGGTHLVKDIYTGSSSSEPGSFISYNGLVYFDATDSAHGEEMWVTDGTPEGTKIFRDLASGSGTFSNPCIMNGILYFVSVDTAGKELWHTDGTPQGTQRVKDIYMGIYDSAPTLLTVYNNILYFVATNDQGAELWRSDGTENGTYQVKDIRTGFNGSSITELKVAGSYLYFNANNGTAGTELWRTDGTPDGTIMLGDLIPGSAASSPRSLTEMNGLLYCLITNASGGYDLWKSAGTPATTQLVTNFAPAGVVPPKAMISAFGRLFFVAADLTTTQRVWSSDGTAAGTHGETGVDPLGFPQTYVNRLIPFAGQIYESGDDGVWGVEPWRYTDVWAPQVWNKTFDQSTAPAVSFTFSEDISAFSPGIQITNLTTSQDISPDQTQTTYDSTTHTLRIEFGGPGALPADGNYRLTLQGASISDLAANTMASDETFDFFILTADANHDRAVGFADLVAVAQNYGQSGKTYVQGDFNYDGIVDFNDLVLTAQHYGTTLTPLPAPSAAQSTDVLLSPLRKDPLLKTPLIKPAPQPAPQIPSKRTRAPFSTRLRPPEFL